VGAVHSIKLVRLRASKCSSIELLNRLPIDLHLSETTKNQADLIAFQRPVRGVRARRKARSRRRRGQTTIASVAPTVPKILRAVLRAIRFGVLWITILVLPSMRLHSELRRGLRDGFS
jgi:hypothetical protein